MIFDSISISEGGNISNATIASGTSFPSNPSTGELFYRTDIENEGLYVYAGASWTAVGQGGTVDFSGLNVKAAVRVATTTNITLSGLQTIDGVSLIAGERVLVKNQTTASQNGIYIVSSGAWSRSSDFDGSPSNEVEAGDFVFVTNGNTHADTGWVVTTNGAITVGTTAINWAQFTASPAYLGSQQIGFGSAGGILTGSSKLLWDDTNNTLTIGSAGFNQPTHILGTFTSGPGNDLIIEAATGYGAQRGGNLLLKAGGTQNKFTSGSNAPPYLGLFGGETAGNDGDGGPIIFFTADVRDQYTEKARFTHTGTLQLGGPSLDFLALGARIRGNFSDATASNRVLFQTSVANANTNVAAIPNGTGTASMGAYALADANNSPWVSISSNTANGVSSLNSGANGTGTVLPIGFRINGSEVARINPAGAWSFGSSGSAFGTAGQVLMSAGDSAPPAWQDITSLPPSGSMYKVRAYLNTAPSTTATGWQKVPIATLQYDTHGNFWVPASTRINPKVAGYYMVSVRVRTTSNGSLATAIAKNGTIAQAVGADADNIRATGGTGIIFCNGTTDYIEAYVYAVTVRTYGAAGSVDTWIELVGPL